MYERKYANHCKSRAKKGKEPMTKEQFVAQYVPKPKQPNPERECEECGTCGGLVWVPGCGMDQDDDRACDCGDEEAHQ